MGVQTAPEGALIAAPVGKKRALFHFLPDPAQISYTFHLPNEMQLKFKKYHLDKVHRSDEMKQAALDHRGGMPIIRLTGVGVSFTTAPVSITDHSGLRMTTPG